MGKALNNKRKLGEYAENLGARASDPTTRLDGTALQAGDTYFKTGEGTKVYDGSAFVGGEVAWADVTGKPSSFTPSVHTHVATDISDSTTVGRSVLTAVDAAAARTAIGAGTSSATGTVTTVSVATANGFAGTVATATSTPAITLTTSLTGMLKGNGTAMSVAVAGIDFQNPLVSGTNIKTVNGTSLLGSGDITIGGGGGSGDVVGPASSTDNTLPRFDGTTGKLLQGSGVTVDDSNNLSTPGNVLSTGGLIGYGSGAGGTVTQVTSKSTSVTLNKPNGVITLNNSALASGATVGFQLFNSFIAQTDSVVVNLFASQTSVSQYRVFVDRVETGYAWIVIQNYTGGSLSEAFSIKFAVIKGGTT